MSKRIDVKNLDIYYGDFLAVKDVSVTIEPRSVTALIGPSGCGKSTFLRSLNRMHEVIPGAHVQGEVIIDGENLYGKGVDPVMVRRKVGMVFQKPNPFPTMSIRENVLAGVKLNNRRIKKADADELVDRRIGDPQRVHICRGDEVAVAAFGGDARGPLVGVPVAADVVMIGTRGVCVRGRELDDVCHVVMLAAAHAIIKGLVLRLS